MPDQRHHMLFATMWNTGIRIGEARTLTPESFDLDGLRPFVRVLSEKVRLVPLTDVSFVRQMESWMVTTRPRRREPLWPVTDETMRNWLKQAVKRAEADGGAFFDSGHTTYLPAQLYHAHALSPPAPEGYSGAGRSQGSALDGGVYAGVRAGHGRHTGCAVHRDGHDAAQSCGHSPSDVTTSLITVYIAVVSKPYLR
ncbi:putative recombinase [Escherichia coli]|uniref:Putative recombinase n=1 Tax=Escherichia coli TaxID=562 RepID=A0A377HGL4_ECOLX|nr:putative recombinase [Escherichia coli]